MNLGPAGDWDLTEELTWEMKIRFDEFAAGDQNVISCEQGKGAIMIRNNGANLQFYVNDGSWKGGTCCTIELNKWYHITATYKANDKMHFYLDGRLVKSFACGKAIVEPTCNLQLGTAPPTRTATCAATSSTFRSGRTSAPRPRPQPMWHATSPGLRKG